MKLNRIIGILLLVLAAATVVGMVLNQDVFWSVYNYAVILFSVPAGVLLLRKK